MKIDCVREAESERGKEIMKGSGRERGKEIMEGEKEGKREREGERESTERQIKKERQRERQKERGGEEEGRGRGVTRGVLLKAANPLAFVAGGAESCRARRTGRPALFRYTSFVAVLPKSGDIWWDWGVEVGGTPSAG